MEAARLAEFDAQRDALNAAPRAKPEPSKRRYSPIAVVGVCVAGWIVFLAGMLVDRLIWR